MTRLIKEDFLDRICKYQFIRYKEDSHCECETYCSLPPRDYGNEPICEYQCTKEADNERIQ